MRVEAAQPSVLASVILATRNRSKLLASTLEHLRQQRSIDFPWEVLVVDNGSTDETAVVLRNFAAKLPLIALYEPVSGKSRSINRALPVARGALLVFTDDDVEPATGWLAAIAHAAADWPAASIFGGPISPRFPKETPPWLKHHEFSCAAFARFDPDCDEGILPANLCPWGANFAVRASALDGLRFDEGRGPRDGSYPMGGETDFLRRLRAGGAQAVFAPTAWMRHIIRPEQITLPWLFRRSFNSGRQSVYSGDCGETAMLLRAPRHLWRRLLKNGYRFLRTSRRASPRKRLDAGLRFYMTWGQIREHRSRPTAARPTPPRSFAPGPPSDSLRPSAPPYEKPGGMPTGLTLEHLDWARSPFSGLTRRSWVAAGRALLASTLQHTHGLREPLRLPPSLAAGYPRLTTAGLLSASATGAANFEAYARSALLAAALLRDQPDLTIEGKSVAAYYREQLLIGIEAGHPAGFRLELAGDPPQQLVEASILVIALTLAPDALWSPLSPRERERVLHWLGALRYTRGYDNNWSWFTILVNAFLAREGHSWSRTRVAEGFDTLRALHVDRGWFRDPKKTFDFYSSWVFQVYPVIWSLLDRSSSSQPLREWFVRRNHAFLNDLPHLFSRRGFMPKWGRSICYRFAASAALGIAFLGEDPPEGLAPGFARRLCSGNLAQFVTHPCFLKHGAPSLGFYGEEAGLIDSYSCVGSPLYSYLAFLPLALPQEHPYWCDQETEGFWSAPPREIRFGSTGLWVEHDESTGHTKLHSPKRSPSRHGRAKRTQCDTADVDHRYPPTRRDEEK